MTATLNSTNRAISSDRSDMAVPWSYVVPLAILLSFSNGFWIVSLRGAVGAIERTSSPFSAWVRESTILLPWYGLAVLVALALALRWFGCRPRGFADSARTIGLLVASAALAGTLALLASTILDHRLQTHHLTDMAETHAGCDSVCVSERVQANLQLEMKAVLVGAALIAMTSLVVVLLLVACRGGRILAGRPGVERTLLAVDQRVLLAASLLGAAAIHAAVVPEHLSQWGPAGVFFLVLTAAGVTVAVAVMSSQPSVARMGAYAAIALSVGSFAVWLLSRTTGLPFGPEAWNPEPVGLADVMVAILAYAALVLAIPLLLARGPRTWSRYSCAIALAAVLSATTLGIGGSALPMVNLFPGIDWGHHLESDDSGGTL